MAAAIAPRCRAVSLVSSFRQASEFRPIPPELFRFYLGRDETSGDDPLLRQMYFDFANGDQQGTDTGFHIAQRLPVAGLMYYVDGYTSWRVGIFSRDRCRRLNGF